jgi:hypothetical protein
MGIYTKEKLTTLDANATVSAHKEERLFSNNNWQDNTVTNYLFDNQNRLTELLEKRNLNGVLTNYSKATYTYNPAGKNRNDYFESMERGNLG